MWKLAGRAGGLCRVCLNEEAESPFTPLDGHVSDCSAPSLGHALTYVTKRELEKNNNLPDSVCPTCVQKISTAYELILQYEKSEILLKKTMDQVYSQIESILSEDLDHDNDTILIVMPGSEINKNNQNGVDSQDVEIEGVDDETDNNLFVFTLQNIKKEDDSNSIHPQEGLKDVKEEIVLESSEVNDEYLDYKSKTLKIESSQEDSNSSVNKNDKLSHVYNFNDECYDIVLEEDIVNDNCDSETKKDYSTDDFTEVPMVFECSDCKSNFLLKEELLSHICEPTVIMDHVCTICSDSFENESLLKQHYLEHAEDDNDDKTYTIENSYEIDIEDSKYFCSLCDTRLDSKHLYVEHMKSEHYVDNWTDDKSLSEMVESPKITNEIYTCTMCGEQFETVDEFRQHKKSHPEGTRHVCNICGKSYLEASTLKRHMIIHTGKKTYLCPVCGKSFFYRNILKSHMVYHNEKQHKCPYCDKKFHVKHILREHIRMIHSEDRFNYMCELCGKLCSSRRRFNIHKESHNAMCCPVCGKNYRNMRYFKQHLQMHNGVKVPKKIFECDYCGEQRPLKTLMELHILSKHLKERRFACKVCDKSFFSKGSLSEHEFLHSGTKSEKCNICGRILANKKALILHNRLHTGERPYPCFLCDDRFLSSSRRRAHIKSKHGERTEQCPMCSSKFYLRSELNKHMLVHSKEPKKGKKEFALGV